MASSARASSASSAERWRSSSRISRSDFLRSLGSATYHDERSVGEARATSKPVVVANAAACAEASAAMISRIVGDALFGGRQAGFFDDDDAAVRLKRSPRENAPGLEGDGENIGAGAAPLGSSDFDRLAARSCCDWMSRKDNATLLDGALGVEVSLSNSPERNILNEPLTREEDDGGVRGAAFATTCDASGGLPTSTFSSCTLG
mmetsp:Transcript_1032/g.4345  ORF Transcript_1032/g.4345 Transcript_1032/m.4345 type:complete len:204 (+) Transcript_1032:225-836(+)